MPFRSTVWFVSGRPSFADLPAPVRLRKLIEVHASLTRSYRLCYRRTARLLSRCRELPLELAGPLSREQLVESATEVRNFVAQFYTFALRAVELNANELAPGTYSTPVPTASMDWEKWEEQVREFLELLGAMAKYEDEFGTLEGFPEGPAISGGVSGSASELRDTGF